MNEFLDFDEKFSDLAEYYAIDSPEEIKNQIRMNENIFQFLQDVRPYLEESFDDAEFSLGMNFEPEIDYRFIILFINVSQEKFNNGIGDEIRSFNLKIKSLRKELGIFRDVLVFPEIKYV